MGHHVGHPGAFRQNLSVFALHQSIADPEPGPEQDTILVGRSHMGHGGGAAPLAVQKQVAIRKRHGPHWAGPVGQHGQLLGRDLGQRAGEEFVIGQGRFLPAYACFFTLGFPLPVLYCGAGGP